MEIYKLLKEHNAKGEQRAIKTKEIMAITGMSQREVTKAVQREREKHFICSTMRNGGGYYRPAHGSEIERYKNSQEKRIAMHVLSLRLARRFIRKRNSNLQ